MMGVGEHSIDRNVLFEALQPRHGYVSSVKLMDEDLNA